MKRILTAAALVPLVVYVVLAGPPWAVYTMVVAVCAICYHEYSGIAEAYGFGKLGPLGYGAGLLLIAAAGEALAVGTCFAAVALALSMRTDDLARTLPRAALMVMGVFYVFGPFRCALLIREVSPHWLMYALLVSWIGDTGAYYVGRRWGRHKLAPRISPAKSWEGAAASVAVAIAAGVLYLHWTIPAVSWLTAALLSAVVNAAGQAGDLAESAMKRGAGIKDSGTILPGHGGFLDRVDSSLFTLPAVYLYLRAVQF